MNQSKIENVQPEQLNNNEQKADSQQVSPSIVNALVGGSFDVANLQNEIKETRKKLNELEDKLAQLPHFVLMYRFNKGKHTWVLHPIRQVANLKINGWVECEAEDVGRYIPKVNSVSM